jgi:hypothetical protein
MIAKLVVRLVRFSAVYAEHQGLRASFKSKVAKYLTRNRCDVFCVRLKVEKKDDKACSSAHTCDYCRD